LPNYLEKYESQWEGLSHILWKIKNVLIHIFWETKLLFSSQIYGFPKTYPLENFWKSALQSQGANYIGPQQQNILWLHGSLEIPSCWWFSFFSAGEKGYQ
jgi:hypothetical protein